MKFDEYEVNIFSVSNRNIKEVIKDILLEKVYEISSEDSESAKDEK